MGICHSYTPDGRCISLLKLLLTNVCIWDCAYCVNRRSSNIPRARFKVDEVVRLTIDFYKRNYIEGLFLSSGIIQNADYTMEQLVLVARKLREEEHFGGYIHLKAVPGASEDILLEAGKYADRLSANIELPLQKDLDELAPEKTLDEIETTMGQLKSGIDEAKDRKKDGADEREFARAGQSTQLVIGATASTDAVILTKAQELYNKYALRRVYYSAFSPAEHTDSALQTKKAPLVREHRLYQADWLIRNYGYKADEITRDLADQNLDLSRDPKLAWALTHRWYFPVDVNRDGRNRLLRVPGMGVKNVDRIIRTRRYHRLTLADLIRMRVVMKSAKWFITTSDHNPSVLKLDRLDLGHAFGPLPEQPSLFGAAQTAASVVMGQL